jgi:hypothetical protein
MAAIEYGSYYWCVILERAGGEPESIHLHADEMEIDQKGTLLFRSAGRRAAGADPQQNGREKKEDKNNKFDQSANSEHGSKENGHKSEEKKKLMTYVAFAPGTWLAVYAAKLKDGSAAAVEHWNVANGKPGLLAVVGADAGAEGYSPPE